MSTLRTRIVASVQAYLTKTVGSAHPPVAPDVLSKGVVPIINPAVFDWADGTAAGQASKVIDYEQGVNNNGFVTVDLSAMEDPFGDLVNFGKVKFFMLQVVAGPGVLYWHDAFNPFTPAPAADMEAKGLALGDTVLIVRPAGIAVTGANKMITFGASGGSVVVRLVIVGDAAP